MFHFVLKLGQENAYILHGTKTCYQEGLWISSHVQGLILERAHCVLCLYLITCPGRKSDTQLNLQNFNFLGVKGICPRRSMQPDTNAVGALAASPS